MTLSLQSLSLKIKLCSLCRIEFSKCNPEKASQLHNRCFVFVFTTSHVKIISICFTRKVQFNSKMSWFVSNSFKKTKYVFFCRYSSLPPVMMNPGPSSGGLGPPKKPKRPMARSIPPPTASNTNTMASAKASAPKVGSNNVT